MGGIRPAVRLRVHLLIGKRATSHSLVVVLAPRRRRPMRRGLFSFVADGSSDASKNRPIYRYGLQTRPHGPVRHPGGQL